ncbi:MAG: terminase family protein [Terriglobia bacterium]
MTCTFVVEPAAGCPDTTTPAENPADPIAFVRTQLGFEPDEPQRRVLSSSAKRGILNCTRQWGKSTITAAKALHRAWSEPGSLVLVASPTDRQSAEFVLKTREFAGRMGLSTRGDGHNRCSLLLPNGSRIVGLPGTEETVRGFSAVSLLLIDEAAIVPDELYRALRPTLAVKDGDLWLMSTPRRKHGFFYQTWAHGGDDWERVGVPATECARISRSFLEGEREALGNRAFRREYMTEFEDGGVGVFNLSQIENALDGTLRPLAFQETWCC